MHMYIPNSMPSISKQKYNSSSSGGLLYQPQSTAIGSQLKLRDKHVWDEQLWVDVDDISNVGWWHIGKANTLGFDCLSEQLLNFCLTPCFGEWALASMYIDTYTHTNIYVYICMQKRCIRVVRDFAAQPNVCRTDARQFDELLLLAAVSAYQRQRRTQSANLYPCPLDKLTFSCMWSAGPLLARWLSRRRRRRRRKKKK